MSTSNAQLLQEILSPTKFNQFASENYHSVGGQLNHFPTNEEVIAHLKVLKAFQALKVNIVGIPIEESFDENFSEFSAKQVKSWQAYLTNAARRFVIFMSALKYKFKFNEQFVNEQQQLINYRSTAIAKLVADYCRRNTPPMDILMIWHAFSLNPKSYYDNGIRNNFLEFTFCPFPLFQILQFIDNATFQYFPSASCVNNFENLTKSYGIPLQYHYNFDIKMTLPIYCPQCQNSLAFDIPLTNQYSQGFADPSFLTLSGGACFCCPDSKMINHLELRKRQFLADLKNPTVPLANVTKHHSSILSSVNDKDKVSHIDQKIKKSGLLYKQFLNDAEDVTTYAQLVQRTRAKDSTQGLTRIMQLYDQMNLIHLTIPPPHGVIQISEDLVACTARQERFVAKMNSFNWLSKAGDLTEIVEKSCLRYNKFLHLLIEYYKSEMLVPTMDIDLVWHTHQLSPLYYIQYCRAYSDLFVIDHDEKVNELKISTRFEHTGILYKHKYQEEYLICVCWYCALAHKNSDPVVESLFSRKTNSGGLTPRTGSSTPTTYSSTPRSLFGQENSSHILAHNAVVFQSRDSCPSAKRQRRNQKRPYPWNNSNPETLSLCKYGNVFALDPIMEEEASFPSSTEFDEGNSSHTFTDNLNIYHSDAGEYLPTPQSRLTVLAFELEFT